MTFTVLLNSIGLFLVFAAHFAVALILYRRTPEGWRWLALALMMVGTFVAWLAVAVPFVVVSGMLLCTSDSYCGPGTRLWRTYYETIGLPATSIQSLPFLTLVLVLLVLYGLALVRPLLLRRLAGSPLRFAVSAPVLAALMVLALMVPTILNINATTAPP